MHFTTVASILALLPAILAAPTPVPGIFDIFKKPVPTSCKLALTNGNKREVDAMLLPPSGTTILSDTSGAGVFTAKVNSKCEFTSVSPALPTGFKIEGSVDKEGKPPKSSTKPDTAAGTKPSTKPSTKTGSKTGSKTGTKAQA